MTAPRSALLVIDLQTGMLDGRAFPPLAGHERLIETVVGLIAAARAAGLPVAFVRHDGEAGDALAPGAPGWPVWPALGQAPEEPTFAKSVGDAFSQPALAAWLARAGVEQVILAGAQTDQCVSETVKGALAAGYGVEVAADAHSTWDWNGETAQEIIARCNAEFAAAGAKVASAAEIACAMGESLHVGA